MCHQKHINELDTLAKQLWMLHREVAAGLLTVARVRLQQACWSLERGERYQEARCVRESA